MAVRFRSPTVSVRRRVISADGVALSAIAVTQAAAVLFGRRIDAPVTGHFLCYHQHRQLIDGHHDVSPEQTYPTHSVDAHVPCTRITRRTIHQRVAKHDRV
jgi:hypothetical protein